MKITLAQLHAYLNQVHQNLISGVIDDISEETKSVLDVMFADMFHEINEMEHEAGEHPHAQVDESPGPRKLFYVISTDEYERRDNEAMEDELIDISDEDFKRVAARNDDSYTPEQLCTAINAGETPCLGGRDSQIRYI
jgi:hypothetical protein